MQNLKKTASMVDGQVGYHRPENVRRCKIAKNNTIVRQLEKTKRELHPDLAKEQQDRLNEIQKQKKAQRILEEKQKKMEALERKREQEEQENDKSLATKVKTLIGGLGLETRIPSLNSERKTNAE